TMSQWIAHTIRRCWTVSGGSRHPGKQDQTLSRGTSWAKTAQNRVDGRQKSTDTTDVSGSRLQGSYPAPCENHAYYPGRPAGRDVEATLATGATGAAHRCPTGSLKRSNAEDFRG